METEFKIEKGVPLTSSRANSKYPFKDMAVGDSFVVTLNGKGPDGLRGRLYMAARASGALCATRVIGANQLRVWRTK